MYSNKLTFKFGSDAPLNGIKIANYDLFNRKREKNASADQQKTLTITARKKPEHFVRNFQFKCHLGRVEKSGQQRARCCRK